MAIVYVRRKRSKTIMDAKQYQKLASRTLLDKPIAPISDHDIMIVWNVIGLAGEVGEIADLIVDDFCKKDLLSKEIGDAMWYCSAIATKLWFDLGEIIENDTLYDFSYMSKRDMALALCISVTNISELCKKGIFHRHDLDKEDVFRELVRVTNSLSALATINGLTLKCIMEDNINKLRERYPDGFSSEDSKKRIDVR